MKVLYYNKLIRDNIPAQVEKLGKRIKVKRLDITDDITFLAYLNKKLKEEVKEYLATSEIEKQIEEIADIIEVCETIASVHKISAKALYVRRLEKLKKNGGYISRVILKSVRDAGI